MSTSSDHLPSEWTATLAGWAADRPEIAELWLYGSRVKGSARPDSDLDIAVLLTSASDLSKVIRQARSLEDSLQGILPVPVDFDVMNSGYLGDDILAEIVEHGRLVFRREKRDNEHP